MSAKKDKNTIEVYQQVDEFSITHRWQEIALRCRIKISIRFEKIIVKLPPLILYSQPAAVAIPLINWPSEKTPLSDRYNSAEFLRHMLTALRFE